MGYRSGSSHGYMQQKTVKKCKNCHVLYPSMEEKEKTFLDEPVIHWGELTRENLLCLSRYVDVALLPVGSLEQHGPHLPLDTDSYDAKYILEEAVKLLDCPKPPILPTVAYGVSDHHMSFPGTVTLRPETLEAVIMDIGRSVATHGFQKLFISNGHGGNTSVLNVVARKLKKETGLLVFIDSGDSMEPGKKELVKTENDVHAGEYETSTSLANRKELVDTDAIPELEMDFPHPSMSFDHKPNFQFAWDTHELSSVGVLGDPSKATAEKGRELWKLGAELMAERIKIVMEMRGYL